MSSTPEYLSFVLEQLSDLHDISYRKMMNEHILYYNDRIIGGIYDNRFLIKPTDSAKKLISEPRYELPYQGAKEMILVENIDDKEFLTTLISKMYSELPPPKNKK